MRYALLVLMVLLAVPVIHTHAIPKEGEKAPYFNISTYEGDRVSTERLKGKAYLLVFAAEWCPHCRRELPGLSQAWREAGLVRNDTMCIVIMVSSSRDRAVRFYKSVNPPPNWRLVPDGNYIAEKYGVQAVPTMIIVDKGGKVVRTFRGEVPPRQVTDVMDGLLGITPQGNYTSQSPTPTGTQAEARGPGLKLGHIILIGLGAALVAIFGFWYYRTLKKFERSKGRDVKKKRRK